MYVFFFIDLTMSQPSVEDASLWRCNFDGDDHPDGGSMCGMIQSTQDELDWTLARSPTPSGDTGPDAAYDGSYYIFVEASYRADGDKAR